MSEATVFNRALATSAGRLSCNETQMDERKDERPRNRRKISK